MYVKISQLHWHNIYPKPVFSLSYKITIPGNYGRQKKNSATFLRRCCNVFSWTVFLGQLLFEGMDLDQGFSGYWIKGLVFHLGVYWICCTKERHIWFSKNRTFCDCCVVAVLTGSENYYING
jgi:hypothetical protein